MTDLTPVRPSRRADPAPMSPAPAPPVPKLQWRKTFLEHLAASSNVTQSAKAAGVTPQRAYKTRREDQTFARNWEEALCEGYDHLEMELVARLREGELKPKIGAKKGVRAYDNANALRLLLWHRETVTRVKARHSALTDAQLRAQIEARFMAMRERILAVQASAVQAGSVQAGALPVAVIGGEGQS